MTYEEMQARQLRLSMALAAIFLSSVFCIPFLNHGIPTVMLAPVMGVPLVWLVVGVLLHVEFWIIAVAYTLCSNKWEREIKA